MAYLSQWLPQTEEGARPWPSLLIVCNIWSRKEDPVSIVHLKSVQVEPRSILLPSQVKSEIIIQTRNFKNRVGQSDWGQSNILYHHCWRGSPQNASSCLFHESAVLEQVWLCQAKHPMLVPDGAEECASLNSKGKRYGLRQREEKNGGETWKIKKEACGRPPILQQRGLHMSRLVALSHTINVHSDVLDSSTEKKRYGTQLSQPFDRVSLSCSRTGAVFKSMSPDLQN